MPTDEESKMKYMEPMSVSAEEQKKLLKTQKRLEQNPYLRLQFFGEYQIFTQLTQITRAVFFDCPWYSLYQ